MATAEIRISREICCSAMNSKQHKVYTVCTDNVQRSILVQGELHRRPHCTDQNHNARPTVQPTFTVLISAFNWILHCLILTIKSMCVLKTTQKSPRSCHHARVTEKPSHCLAIFSDLSSFVLFSFTVSVKINSDISVTVAVSWLW